jgi:catechol 2,3-dioxygenase-like lactoylglutathione lyase family enzyme
MMAPTHAPAEIQHIGISVADLDRSVAWYRSHFGFSEAKRFRKEAFEISGAVLQLGGMILEVLAPFVPAPPAPQAGSLVEQLRRTGVNHIAINVADLPACREQRRASRASLLTEIIDGRFFFCIDPDGTVLEVRAR